MITATDSELWHKAQSLLHHHRELRRLFHLYYRKRRPGENYRNYKRGRERAFRRWCGDNMPPLTGKTL